VLISILSKLNVPSLELRRLHIDLIMCYKIVFSLVDVKFDDFPLEYRCYDTRASV